MWLVHAMHKDKAPLHNPMERMAFKQLYLVRGKFYKLTLFFGYIRKEEHKGKGVYI